MRRKRRRATSAPLLTADPDAQSENVVNDYLIPNILVTLLCCPILGIVGIAYSVASRGAKRRGDWVQAGVEAENAKSMFWLSLGVGLVPAALFFYFYFVVGGLPD